MVILAVRGAGLPDKSQRENSPKALNPLNEGCPSLRPCAPNKNCGREFVSRGKSLYGWPIAILYPAQVL